MIEANRVQNLRELISTWRSTSVRVALVPTMGNLHEGHMKLVEVAKTCADKVVVSLFVNPTQFSEGEDFQSYPKTLIEDKTKLQSAGVDLLFAPEVTEMYPVKINTVIDVPDLSNILCGHFRPGHFQGVATVVCKLLNMVQPDTAVFGEKDFQQLTIIRRMVMDLNLPIDIIGIDTLRETDGLAMSSRNAYLSGSERALAPRLYEALCSARQQLAMGKRCYTLIEQEGSEQLQQAGFRVDYFSIRQRHNLMPVDVNSQHWVILAATWLGRARLIDNVRVDAIN